MVLPSGQTSTDVMRPKEPKPEHGTKPVASILSHAHSLRCGSLIGETLTLSQDVRLHVSVVVLAGPHESSGGLQDLGHHVVNKAVLVPDFELVELGLVVPEEDRAGETLLTLAV